MTTYYDHHNGSKSRIESDTVECPDILVSEAATTEERAAFVWQWSRLTREDGLATLILEGACNA